MSASKAPLESWGETAARSTAEPPISPYRSTSGMRPCFAGSPSRGERGFTLLELSIVLVIIGLIVGGITVGADMIRAAEQRSLISDIQQYKTAVRVFKDKYFYLPGDLPNASSFWPTDCTDDGSNSCDGDGSGQIDQDYTGTDYEGVRAWQHLSLAGLIEGSYSGLNHAHRAGENAPGTAIDNTVLQIWNPNVWGVTSAIAHRVAICLRTNGWTYCEGGQGATLYRLFAEDAWGMDKKIDDGSARTGDLIADSCHSRSPQRGFDDVTIYRSTSATYEYNLTDETSSCGLMFLF